ncbi:hypothetical protein [Rhodococcus qingshengii]|uniref:hypothetical protein n=1 Tax=Rhodococcus qingshengii TaxID=334542 RepID=UPI002150B0E3|nr:hypothetical protein [Rhodococcus qingshengii]
MVNRDAEFEAFEDGVICAEPFSAHRASVGEVDAGGKDGVDESLLMQLEDMVGVRSYSIALRAEDEYRLAFLD